MVKSTMSIWVNRYCYTYSVSSQFEFESLSLNAHQERLVLAERNYKSAQARVAHAQYYKCIAYEQMMVDMTWEDDGGVPWQ